MSFKERIEVLESKYQATVIKKVKEMIPGCIVLKTDPNYIQGFPDLLILANNRWASLEVKRNAKASKRPNQDYYVEKTRGMSFGAFIFPENEEEVLDELRRVLSSNE